MLGDWIAFIENEKVMIVNEYQEFEVILTQYLNLA
jgi:hypothetical protein